MTQRERKREGTEDLPALEWRDEHEEVADTGRVWKRWAQGGFGKDDVGGSWDSVGMKKWARGSSGGDGHRLMVGDGRNCVKV